MWKGYSLTEKTQRTILPHVSGYYATNYKPSNIKMKKIATLTFNLILTINILGQTINVSDNLILTQLTENTFIHTCENSNGLIYINEGQALIVSTPDSDNETQNLIDWVIKDQNAKIVGYVIDRWHPDAMEGLDIVQKNGIKTYSYEL